MLGLPLYVYFETHYEQFNHNADRIYRATHVYAPPGRPATQWARIPTDYINRTAEMNFPQLKRWYVLKPPWKKYVRIGTENSGPRTYNR